MATVESRKLSITYLDTDGKSKTISYNYAASSLIGNDGNPTAEATQDMKDFAAALKANGAIFKSVPATVKSAKIVVQDSSAFNLS